MRLEGRQADSLLGDVGGALVLAGTQGVENFRERQQVVSHVGKHVLSHGRWHLDQLPGVTCCDCGSSEDRENHREHNNFLHMRSQGELG